MVLNGKFSSSVICPPRSFPKDFRTLPASELVDSTLEVTEDEVGGLVTLGICF